jgi:hypothetical protein
MIATRDSSRGNPGPVSRDIDDLVQSPPPATIGRRRRWFSAADGTIGELPALRHPRERSQGKIAMSDK